MSDLSSDGLAQHLAAVRQARGIPEPEDAPCTISPALAKAIRDALAEEDGEVTP